MKKLWKQRMEPFKIWGNLWFCGSVPSSCHVIDTGEGLILIDPGLPETFYLVVQGLWELGFEPKQVKAILHTHGHYDHAGATKLLLGLAPEAKTYIGAGINSMMLEYYAAHGLDPSERDAFVPGLKRIRDEHVDICLGSHTYCNGTQGKGKKVLAGDRYAFVDETEWAKYCDKTIATFEAMVARGQ